MKAGQKDDCRAKKKKEITPVVVNKLFNTPINLLTSHKPSKGITNAPSELEKKFTEQVFMASFVKIFVPIFCFVFFCF